MPTPADLSAERPDATKASVLQMYLAYPYPNYSAEERRRIFAAELCRYRFLGLEDALRGARVIDVGCGTGHRVMPIAQHFGAKVYVGFDHSTASLDVARQLKEELGYAGAELVEGDIFALPYPDASFDVVISQGVLHHTSDPYRGFRELVRVCRPGGFVDIYLYNLWNHWRHNLQKARVSRLAGTDIEQRFAVAHRLYGTKPVDQMTPAEIAGFFDQYCHPHKSDHTVGETLEWLEAEGLEYWGSYPPLGFRDFIAMAQYRHSLLDEYPFFHTRAAAAFATFAAALPAMGLQKPPFRRPGLWHRFAWQALYALQGSGGRYSGGPALCGRKRGGA